MLFGVDFLKPLVIAMLSPLYFFTYKSYLVGGLGSIKYPQQKHEVQSLPLRNFGILDAIEHIVGPFNTFTAIDMIKHENCIHFHVNSKCP